jgi:AcrR family transcriptional regulator
VDTRSNRNHMTLAASEPRENRAVGRPRSAESHQAILEATLELVAAEGMQRASIEAIAARAGVGKTTIYRRWSSKEDLIVDALSELHPLAKLVDTGNLREDLVAVLKAFVELVRTRPELERLMFRVLGEAKTHPEFLQVLHDRVYAPRLEQMDRFMRQAQARGEVRRDLDTIFVGSLIAGPFLFHLLISQILPTPYALEDLPEKIVDTVLTAIGTERQPAQESS